MSKAYVYPWNDRSQGAYSISKGLGIQRIRLENSTFTGSPDKIVINWGSSQLPPEVQKCRVINKMTPVNDASDKLKFFERMTRSKSGPRVPGFTSNLETASEWAAEGVTVVARTKLRSRSGNGIVFFDNLKNFTEAKLYTKYIKKKEEYRVHVIFGKPVAIQQKVLRSTDDAGSPIDPKTVDFRVRTASNGFVFQRHNLHTPQDVIAQALLAMESSGLDFGAVDIIWNEAAQQAYVLEINTAPGLEGQTIDDYIVGLKEVI